MTEPEASGTTGHRSAVAGGVSGLDVVPVRSSRDRKRFIRLPWRIYEDDPAWVPPLISDVKKVMDRDRHPFHQHADVEYFLARRNGDVAGRIAAIVNHEYIDFHETPTGFFGLFETVEDQAVADALLETAEDWLRDRGMTRVEGPMNLSTNDELYSPGVVIDGHDEAPMVLMAHTPAYYARLLEAAGYGKAKDLDAWVCEDSDTPPRLLRALERLSARVDGLRMRPLDMNDFDAEVDRIQDIYNDAWERNWGFMPMTEEEIHHLARELKPVVEPDMCIIAEIHGEPAGFALSLPDYNQALKHVNGRLFPFGLLKLLWLRRKIDRARILTLGVTHEYRKTGLGAIIFGRIWKDLVDMGYNIGEGSWILEDNWEMRRTMERSDGYIRKKYRVYGKDLAGGG